MFYNPDIEPHGLAHDPWKSLVIPRPIGWISTMSKDGVGNLAPYSFFNGCGEHPHYVMFASAGVKDSMRNVEETGEFVCVMATNALRDKMNITCADFGSDIDESKIAGLTPVASTNVKPPRVAESPIAFECVHHQTVHLPGSETPGPKPPYSVVFGRVVGIHIDDSVVKDGIIDVGSVEPIARLGYMDYSVVTAETIFSLRRPSVEDVMPKAVPSQS